MIAALNAIAAWGGATALVVGALDFGDTLNDRLPFDSLVLAGIALAVTVALGYYSLPGVPTPTITTDELERGVWDLRR